MSEAAHRGSRKPTYGAEKDISLDRGSDNTGSREEKGGDSTEALPVGTDKEEETAVEAVANGLVAVSNVANNMPQAPIASRPHNTQAKHVVEDPHIYMRARGN